jgi:hypothetical protein
VVRTKFDIYVFITRCCWQCSAIQSLKMISVFLVYSSSIVLKTTRVLGFNETDIILSDCIAEHCQQHLVIKT